MNMKEPKAKTPYGYQLFLTTALLTMMGVVLGGCNLLTAPSAIVESKQGSALSPSRRKPNTISRGRCIRICLYRKMPRC